ncbi:HAMP domain-containing histidine kinase [bacterium 210820-DFI.6.52]|nr:HAMP domain-containing histidine kinase [bacterium 210820-DFI.6.52]
MIKRLQRKFVLIAMGSLLAVMVVLVGAINAVNFVQMDRRADRLLELISQNGGGFPAGGKEPHRGEKPQKEGLLGPGMTEETPFETRYFVVWADGAGQVSQLDTSHIAALSSQEARGLGEEVLASGRTGGYKGSYKYLKTASGSGSMVVFVDCSSQMRTGLFYLVVSCGVAAASFLVVLVLVSVFSRRAVRPVMESLEKQKQFITDAGHEIKTPLAVISANTDVLELESGANQWTESIRNQTARLERLVRDLLALSRMEEGRVALSLSDFSFSDVVEKAAEPFLAPARQRGQTLELAIEPGVSLCGDKGGVRQLVSILLDNAVKYAGEGGRIQLRAGRRGRGAFLEVANTADNLPEGDLDRLFDRFYRADSSRARATGGYGIGLSIARAIAEAHGGRITARRGEGEIRFLVALRAAGEGPGGRK